MADALEQARSRWSGRTAVVTGAAGGLGAGFARVLAGLGARVVLSDADAAALEATASGVGTPVVADVRDAAAVQALADRAWDDGGDVALLINNAGVERVGTAWEQPLEDWQRVIDVNLNGVHNGIRAFVPRMLEAGGDRAVLNIASVAALVSPGSNAAYAVSKHAVLALSESLAEALAAVGAGVQVSVALPGPVRTRIYADADAVPVAEAHLDGLRSMLDEQGMAPDEAATMILGQVAAGSFAVTSHPDWVHRLADARADRLRALLD